MPGHTAILTRHTLPFLLPPHPLTRHRPCVPSPPQLEMTPTPWPRHSGKSNVQVGLAAHQICICHHSCSHDNIFSTSSNVWPHSNVRRPGRMHLHVRTIHCPVDTHAAHASRDTMSRSVQRRRPPLSVLAQRRTTWRHCDTQHHVRMHLHARRVPRLINTRAVHIAAHVSFAATRCSAPRRQLCPPLLPARGRTPDGHSPNNIMRTHGLKPHSTRDSRNSNPREVQGRIPASLGITRTSCHRLPFVLMILLCHLCLMPLS
ncbi:hypothetical protein F5148DRAFT_420345 [Russula earlei]|uniref:Uncharacterized protein n=1 Tax=Russula earlei TaxID=71964 RepID=A0ACC0UHF0_9AGAM|nr:hypothetical protein F5148DRAFT_420345 [Russula earlei]